MRLNRENLYMVPGTESESESHSVMSISYNLMDCSPQGSFVHGILQARILQWVAIPFSRGSSWLRDRTWVSCITGRFFTIWVTRVTHRRTVQWPNHLLFKILRTYVIDCADVCSKTDILKIYVWRNAVTVQGLKLCLPRQRVWVWSLVGEPGPHVPHSQKTKT